MKIEVHVKEGFFYMQSEVQKIIWEIMKTILPIIKRHNLKYYMLGGTLLGAIRHKGFIPWDDDIDIGMPRKDYEKFIKFIRSELPAHMKLHTYLEQSSHHYYFSRIIDTRYEMRRTGSTVERMENVWVDIFPLDGMPNKLFPRKIHMLRLLYVRARYHMATFDRINLRRPNRPLFERIIIIIVKLSGIGTQSDPQKWLNRIDKLLKKNDYEKSNWIVNFMGQYKFKEMFPKQWYGNGKLYDFEDAKLLGPCEYDLVLRQQYGNYMIPPKNQNTHAAEFVK